MALKEFAKEVGAGEHKRVLLVVDKAGWHTGKEVELPEGIHLEFLPSGSPELQPAERLRPLTNEAVAEQDLRSDRGDRGGTDGALHRTARPGRDHQGSHHLPLVASGGMMSWELFSRIQYHPSVYGYARYAAASTTTIAPMPKSNRGCTSISDGRTRFGDRARSHILVRSNWDRTLSVCLQPAGDQLAAREPAQGLPQTLARAHARLPA